MIAKERQGVCGFVCSFVHVPPFLPDFPGTQQTGWNFVSSLRPWMPDGLKGVIWFGVDDSSTTARYVDACEPFDCGVGFSVVDPPHVPARHQIQWPQNTYKL